MHVAQSSHPLEVFLRIKLEFSKTIDCRFVVVAIDFNEVEGIESPTGKVYRAITLCMLKASPLSISDLAQGYKLAYCQFKNQCLNKLCIHQNAMDTVLKMTGVDDQEKETTQILLRDVTGEIVGCLIRDEKFKFKGLNEEDYLKLIERAECIYEPQKKISRISNVAQDNKFSKRMFPFYIEKKEPIETTSFAKIDGKLNLIFLELSINKRKLQDIVSNRGLVIATFEQNVCTMLASVKETCDYAKKFDQIMLTLGEESFLLEKKPQIIKLSNSTYHKNAKRLIKKAKKERKLAEKKKHNNEIISK